MVLPVLIFLGPIEFLLLPFDGCTAACLVSGEEKKPNANEEEKKTSDDIDSSETRERSTKTSVLGPQQKHEK